MDLVIPDFLEVQGVQLFLHYRGHPIANNMLILKSLIIEQAVSQFVLVVQMIPVAQKDQGARENLVSHLRLYLTK